MKRKHDLDLAIDVRATSRNPPHGIALLMPTEGNKKPDEGSLASLDKSAEVSEKDYKEGQLRKGGQMSESEEESSE